MPETRNEARWAKAQEVLSDIEEYLDLSGFDPLNPKEGEDITTLIYDAMTAAVDPVEAHLLKWRNHLSERIAENERRMQEQPGGNGSQPGKLLPTYPLSAIVRELDAILNANPA